MQNIKLFLILKSLTDAEIKELGKFVSSPFHNKNKTLINVLFRAQQASALANIAMSTAEGIAAAPAQYGCNKLGNRHSPDQVPWHGRPTG